MKVTFTFEYKDLLEQIVKMLSMSGVTPLKDEVRNDGLQITFNHKRKEVVVHCEASPIPDTCPFCTSRLQQEATPTKIDDSNDDSNDETTKNDNDRRDEASQANTGDPAENVPLSMAALKARSSALAARRDSPIRVQRGAEAHAALAKPAPLEGESSDPPFPGEGGV